MNPDFQVRNLKLVKKPDWRWDEDEELGRVVWVWSLRYGKWGRQYAWTGAVLQGLEDGLSFDEIVDAVQAAHPGAYGDKRARRKVGTYLYVLWEEGYVSMDFSSNTDHFPSQYEVVKELGRGGVGVAWLCNDRVRGHQLVVKHAWDYFLPLSVTDGAMRTEAQIIGKFDHRGIIAYYDQFEHDGMLHLVREFVEGEPLLGAKPLSDAEIASSALQVAQILQHCHERGYLLLDVRPENFLRRPSGQVTLVDVGQCKLLVDGKAVLEQVVGSPAYISPEVRRDQIATVCSDAFGLGRLLFNLTAARPPLPQWNQQELEENLPQSSLRELTLALCRTEPEGRPSLDEAIEQLAAFAPAPPVS